MMGTHSKELQNSDIYEDKVIYADEVAQIIKQQYKDSDRFYTPQKPTILFYPNLFSYLIREINRTRMIVLWGNEIARNDKNQFARAFAYELQEYNRPYSLTSC